MFAIIFFRLWFLQVLSGEQYVQQANANDVRPLPIPAPRGQIFDRTGQAIVSSRTTNAVQIVPSALPPAGTPRLRLYRRLGRLLGMSGPHIQALVIKGRTAVRLKRPTLMAFALASGHDPFALYNDTKAYTALMQQVGKTLAACKGNFRFFYDNKDQLLNGIRSGEIWAAMMWDSGGWLLNRENPAIKFINPKSGAIAWMDTFALPARGRNDAAAYAWINFVMRPEVAALVAKSIGNFTASRGADKLMDPRVRAQFAESFPDGLKNIKWYPAIPPGLEQIEGEVLDKVKAAD